MVVTEVQFDPRQILGPADTDKHLAPRSKGLHLSQIYDDLQQSARGMVIGQDKLTSEELQWYRSVGYVWERVVDDAFAKCLLSPNCVRLGEVTVDGITGSPDLVDLSSDDWVVVDTKATFKSSRKLDDLEKNFWTWTVQLKGYCYMVKATRARLLVMHICGNYAPPRPIVKQLELEFTQEELQQNWNVLVAHARRRKWLK